MLRTWKREIARNRLKDMGADHVNRRMGHRKEETLEHEVIAKMQKTAQGRDRLKRILDANPPLWKRVISGDLKKDGDKAFWKRSEQRRFALHPDDK